MEDGCKFSFDAGYNLMLCAMSSTNLWNKVLIQCKGTTEDKKTCPFWRKAGGL